VSASTTMTMTVSVTGALPLLRRRLPRALAPTLPGVGGLARVLAVLRAMAQLIVTMSDNAISHAKKLAVAAA
jgi:hypothetical protein